ncbi:GNAT family N-acetyltransferase [Aureibacillus halotolerans]|uniref:Riboflavin biosynthesis RibT protein n=1 Tax=Aureibacillus halotolerans TaxID=1508390 RepID=A0A4V3D5V8_9BACI|nr:GNAT family N-acetyltransferase [Aureibacillus halotolerans]TDQ41587.1 riboflavin biosynthesis RibT protein [Aureibacillus halotolerans]
MFVKYKKNYEKIAMGLLSFMPGEKDLKKLMATIREYEENELWQLYLWKEEEDMVGIVGVRLLPERQEAELQHICVNPSFRNQGLGHRLVQELKALLSNKYTVLPNEDTAAFFTRCVDEEEAPINE